MKKVLFFVMLFLPFITFAQPGSLDTSFGNSGIALTSANGLLNKIALQSDGKIIGAGAGNFDSQPPFLIIRYNHDGSVDSSFGNNGIGGSGIQLSEVLSLAILPNDAIIALGRVSAYVNVTKFKKDGTVDSSFGNNGTVLTIAGAFDIPTDVVMQTDKKIVVGGYILNESNEARQLFLIRYMPDGSLDDSFGDNGIVILGEINGDKSLSTVNALALQPNGQILASVYLTKGAVYRFNTDGSQDKTFGINGTAYFQTKDNAVVNFQAYGLAVQPDGRIIGGGSSTKSGGNPLHYMAVARLNGNGTIDSTFGTNGLQYVLFENNPSEGTGILLQKDGKLIVTGRTYLENQTYSNLALARFSSFGLPDSSFGNNGQAITKVGNIAVGNSSLLQKNGQILVAGYSDILGSSFVVVRYNNDDLTQKQQIITKIRHWIQHHNGIEWNNVNGANSYVVQRSYDGIHFNSIARINTGSQSNLTYQDPMPLSGNNYYRLQTTSVSGVTTNSNVIAVTSDDNTIKISPNPAINSLHIEGLSSNAKLIIVDFAGNVKLQTQANGGNYNLNIASLKAGNYLLKIETKDDVVTKSFVKE
jgi:uncharacterized delta-60 repeat protein